MRAQTRDSFLRFLVEAVEGDNDLRFAFFLGAGCSRSSGVPTAGALVHENWLPRLATREGIKEADIVRWASKRFVGYTPQRAPEFYGEVMAELFPSDDARQLEIRNLCLDRTPSAGYGALVQLLALPGRRLNVAISTNFDDLPSQAATLTAIPPPIVIRDQVMAQLVRPDRDEAHVIMLHGDHRLRPLNTALETAQLAADLYQPVIDLLRGRGLIFVGYGGRDAGVLNMLERLPDRTLSGGVWWLSAQQPDGPMRGWLEKQGATWINCRDFDNFMLDLRAALSLPAHDVVRLTERVHVVAGIQQPPDDVDAAFDAATEIATSRGFAAAEASFRAAMGAASGNRSQWLSRLGDLLSVVVGDLDGASRVYEEAIRMAPGSGPIALNAALFAATLRGDPEGGWQLLQTAEALAPDAAEVASAQALYAEQVLKDDDLTEQHLRRALGSAPGDVNLASRLALLLADRRGQLGQAVQVLSAVRSRRPEDPQLLSNLSAFVAAAGKDDEALALLEKAYELASDDQLIASNLGWTLYQMGEHVRAEVYLRDAADGGSGPDQAVINFAAFLSNRGDSGVARRLYLKSLEHRRSGPVLLSFAEMEIGAGDVVAAEARLLDALAADPEFEAAQRRLAFLLADTANDPERTEREFIRLLELSGQDLVVLERYAEFRASVGDRQGAEELLRRATSAGGADWQLGVLSARRLRECNPSLATLAYQSALDTWPTVWQLRLEFAAWLAQLGELDRADTLFTDALDRSRRHPDALVAVARHKAFTRGEDAVAHELFKEAVEAAPDDLALRTGFAEFLQDLKHFPEAAENYERVLATDAEHAEALYNYALFLTHHRRDDERADRLYQRALVATARRPDVLSAYAIFMANFRRDIDRAEELVNEGLREAPAHPGVAIAAATIRKWRGASAREIESIYRRALEVNPSHPYLLNAAALFLNEIGRVDEALELYRRSIASDPRSATHIANMANALSGSGRATEAVAEYERALSLDPTSEYALVNLAHLLEQRGDVARSTALFETAVQHHPRNPDIRLYYAQFLERHDASAATAQYECAATLSPFEAGYRGALALHRWMVHRDAKGAEADFRAALELNPRHVPTLNNFAAFIVTARGDRALALSLLQRALIEVPGDPVILTGVADMLADDPTRAREAPELYRRALTRHGDVAAIRISYGRFLLREGNAAAGVRHLRRALLTANPAECLQAHVDLLAYGPAEALSESRSGIRQLLGSGIITQSLDLPPPERLVELPDDDRALLAAVAAMSREERALNRAEKPPQREKIHGD